MDVQALRARFPGLAQTVHGHPLAYLDNASTTQKPDAVLRALDRVYRQTCANIHRGVHSLSVAATEAYESARETVAGFLGASQSHEVVFTRGTTESLNLIAQTYGRQQVGPGDAILVSELEHHSNIVPWQMLCQEKSAELRVLPIDDRGAVRWEALAERLDARTKIVAISHASNSLGTVLPVAEIAQAAHQVGAVVVVDGAQGAAHGPVDVARLGCDFYAFSGHKVYGPTGVGALWGRRELLESMPPWQGGGEMIASVSFEHTEYADVPARFEAGTPAIAEAIALAEALRFVGEIGFDAIAAHEHGLLQATRQLLEARSDVRLIGTAEPSIAVCSFVVDGVHAHDVGTVLDRHGIAVRTGHHCTEPVMDRFGVDGTVRVSLAAYNTLAEVERLGPALDQVREVFR